jgi:protein-disulfide isomerase
MLPVFIGPRKDLGIKRMLRKLNLMMLLIVCFMAWSIPAQSADQPSGQLLGGSLKSPIRLEVFSDFQCPACRELYLGTITRVLQDYSSKDKVCVIYHEFPLQMHAHSREAARYAEAASHLGQPKLLAVYNVLFTDQAQWGENGRLESSLSKVLSKEELQTVKKMMADTSIDAVIEKEIQLGNKKEIKSTPTMLISYTIKQETKQQAISPPVNFLMMKEFFDSILK